MEKFTDRMEAGKYLANQLKNYANNSNVIALALPRGGVPVAFEIAMALSIPLEVFVVRKLGVPWYQELAMGAIASSGAIFLNEEVIESLNVSKSEIEEVIKKEKDELRRRELVYRPKNSFPNVEGKIVLLIDDGIATGSTMKAAVLALRQKKPAKIIVVAPVSALSTYKELVKLADKIVCPLKPKEFMAVGAWYDIFPQTSDQEVCELLQIAKK